MPPQSAPPVLGSQLSAGSSTHCPLPGHLMAAMPPQKTLGASGTQAAPDGQGALMHMTVCSSQCVPAAHFTVAHALTGGVGGGLHLQVGQPWASGTLPYSQ